VSKAYARLRRLPAAVLAAAAAGTIVLGACTPQKEAAVTPAKPLIQQRCDDLASSTAAWPDPSMRILAAVYRPDGSTADIGFGGMRSPPLPSHCEVTGILHERVGRDGDHYAVRFHVRLPDAWNDRFFFEGGGGTDGNLGAALGMTGFGRPPALAAGYAVVSGDSGHSNEINNDMAAGGAVSFGRDPQARADYGHAALEATYDAAKAVIARYYAHAPARSYFVGCSKGGQEGLAFAERYPDAFDGIVAGDPGMSLPRAALGHAWAAQVFATVVGGGKDRSVPFARLPESFADGDLKLVQQAVLDACDADDGLKDGIVGAFAQCTIRKVAPQLRKLRCAHGKTSQCLSGAQIVAFEAFLGGPKNGKGQSLYASFPWDAGIADPAWRGWTIGPLPGTPAGFMPGPPPKDGTPSIALTMGAGSLAEIFTTPPTVLPADLQARFDYLLQFDFDRDAAAIYAATASFPHSAWDDVNARSPDLDAFAARGGKLIVYHGGSDPVFSINDTIAWWTEVNARLKGHADDTIRLFAVPGMGHCAGGPATDQFDAFGAVVKWVENGQAPDQIDAATSPFSPWRGRTRPLCAYPAVARYTGKGDGERAENFVCRRPGADK